MAVRAENADLTVTGSIDLAQSTIDASLVMQGPAGLGGTSSGRPEVGIVLKGPIGAPKRTLDVAALTNWLSLRQIEQQTKRIESLESGRELPVEAGAAGSSLARAVEHAQTTPSSPTAEHAATVAPPREVRTEPAVGRGLRRGTATSCGAGAGTVEPAFAARAFRVAAADRYQAAVGAARLTGRKVTIAAPRVPRHSRCRLLQRRQDPAARSIQISVDAQGGRRWSSRNHLTNRLTLAEFAALAIIIEDEQADRR